MLLLMVLFISQWSAAFIKIIFIIKLYQIYVLLSTKKHMA